MTPTPVGSGPLVHRLASPAPGTYTLLAHAPDTTGRTQPEATALNIQGYLFDAVVRHPVQVA